MTRHTKPVLRHRTDAVFANSLDLKASEMNAKDLGIEFVHFDSDGNIENQHTMPLDQFISDTPLSSQEYFIKRSLVAAGAGK